VGDASGEPDAGNREGAVMGSKGAENDATRRGDGDKSLAGAGKPQMSTVCGPACWSVCSVGLLVSDLLSRGDGVGEQSEGVNQMQLVGVAAVAREKFTLGVQYSDSSAPRTVLENEEEKEKEEEEEGGGRGGSNKSEARSRAHTHTHTHTHIHRSTRATPGRGRRSSCGGCGGR
jgi:hypothetical protein